MAQDITITVVDGTGDVSQPGQMGNASKQTDNANMKWKQAVGIKAASMVAKSTINFVSSSYGDFTGDYITETKISSVINTTTKIAGLGALALVGGPGALALGLGAEALSVGFDVAKKVNDQKKKQKEVDRLRELSGGINAAWGGIE